MSARAMPSSPITVLASAARTATVTSDVYKIAGKGYRGICLQVNATASAASPSVVCKVQDAATDDWTDVLAAAAITGVATVNLVIHPSAVDIANLSESTAQIRNKWRVVCTADDADSLTYSVRAFLLP